VIEEFLILTGYFFQLNYQYHLQQFINASMAHFKQVTPWYSNKSSVFIQ